MTGRPVFAESAREKVLLPAPAGPVTITRRPTRAPAVSLMAYSPSPSELLVWRDNPMPAVKKARRGAPPPQLSS